MAEKHRSRLSLCHPGTDLQTNNSRRDDRACEGRHMAHWEALYPAKGEASEELKKVSSSPCVWEHRKGCAGRENTNKVPREHRTMFNWARQKELMLAAITRVQSASAIHGLSVE